MTLRIKNLDHAAKDRIIEFVWDEQAAQLLHSSSDDVQSIEDAVQWLKDFEYDWKKIVLKFQQEHWDDDPYTQQYALDQQADYDMRWHRR